MASIGKGLMILGGLIFVVGSFVFFLSRTKIPLGQFPGDIQFRYGNLTCMIPLASSILISIILTLLLNFLLRMLDR